MFCGEEQSFGWDYINMVHWALYKEPYGVHARARTGDEIVRGVAAWHVELEVEKGIFKRGINWRSLHLICSGKPGVVHGMIR